MNRFKKGFSLIELLVVIAIIGILGAIVLSTLRSKGIALVSPTKAYACGGWFDSPCDSNSTQLQDLTANQAKMVAAVPMPQLSNSLERQNIANRAELFNSPDKISYIYLISYGKVMAFYTIKGKVSSLNSYMSPQEQIVSGDGTPCGYYNSGGTCYTVQAPDVDGTYGQNADGIFFFTTNGTYVEWQGDYMMSDQPLSLQTPPEMVMQVK